jgi:beta-lactamase regulating signal transducer with metallopeptidase domain
VATLFLDVALRATLIAAGTACVLWALRVRAPAERHAAWTAVLVSMLLLPIYSLAGPKLPLAVVPGTATSPELDPGASPEPRIGGAGVSLTPLALFVGTAPRQITGRSRGTWVLIALYCLVACALLGRLAIGTVHARRLYRSAVKRAGRATSVRCATPISVGWWSPVLILPDGWEHWSSGHLDAVLTHEQEHLRRRDPLIRWFALLNRAIFWFHPLAWWLTRRLSTLAEEACDAAVLRAGHSPQDYAGYLIDMARAVNQQGRRLNVAGMAMPGSGLPARIRLILEEGAMTPRSRTRALCTLAFCATSSIICAAVTLAPRPSASALSRASGGAHAAADVPGAKSPAPVLQTRSATNAPVLEIVERPRPDSSRRGRGGPPQVTQANASGNALPVGSTARIFVVVVDDLGFTPSEFRNAEQLLAVLRDEIMTEADLVGMVSTGPASVATDLHSPVDPQRLNDSILRITNGRRLPVVERAPGSTAHSTDSRYHARIAVWTATDVARRLARLEGGSKLVVFVRSAETAATSLQAAVADPGGELARDVAELASVARLGNVTMRVVDAGDPASANVLRPLK